MAKTSARFPGVSWVEGPDFITIDAERCNGCGDCAKVCLGDCFALEKGAARVRSLAECMECASCWYICEQDAIRFTWPKGGAGFRTRFG